MSNTFFTFSFTISYVNMLCLIYQLLYHSFILLSYFFITKFSTFFRFFLLCYMESLQRNLGTRYTEDFLLKAFEKNTKSHRELKEEILEQPTPNTSTDLPTVPFSDTSAIPAPFIFIKSDLRLVIDLQTCIKAQPSEAYI